MKQSTYAIVVTALGGILVWLSLTFDKIHGPDAWLIAWTQWLAQYIGIAVAAYSLFKISESLASRIKHSRVEP